MKWTRKPVTMSSSPPSVAALVSLLLLLVTPASASLRCENIQADRTKFDLSKLGGPHSVVTTADAVDVQTNTTWTLDLCKPLVRRDKVKKEEKCPEGTRICGITRVKKLSDPKDEPAISAVIPLVGTPPGLGRIEYKATRLKTSDSPSDVDKEGVRLEIEGEKHKNVPQRAIVELLCDEREGTENEWPPEVAYDTKGLPRRDDGDKGGDQTDKQLKKVADPPLVWDSYQLEGNTEVLRLTWHTMYACEAYANSSQSGRHWGFFTWFVILVFLATASYLIFGSWLNYNRYGARGWDLLPHGDTIRDIPYLLKDWLRRLINTVQGSGSRGGYSAV